MSAVDVVESYLAALPGGTRRLAHGEWGIIVRSEATGEWPLDVGLRIADGILRAQASAVPAHEGLNPWDLLHWNRQTRYVRFACTRAGDVWVHGDLPVGALDEQALDRLLGLVAEAAIAAREHVAALDAPDPPPSPAPAGAWPT